MDKIVQGDSALVLRENVLHEFGDWKFKALYKLDIMLDFRWHDSWEAWGNDHVGHAHQMVADLADSDSRDDLKNAVDEIKDISEMLALDLSEKIAELES